MSRFSYMVLMCMEWRVKVKSGWRVFADAPRFSRRAKHGRFLIHLYRTRKIGVRYTSSSYTLIFVTLSELRNVRFIQRSANMLNNITLTDQ